MSNSKTVMVPIVNKRLIGLSNNDIVDKDIPCDDFVDTDELYDEFMNEDGSYAQSNEMYEEYFDDESGSESESESESDELTEDNLERLDVESVDTGIIYRISNTVNDKVYIGQTKSYRINHGKSVKFDEQKRFKEHVYSSQQKETTCHKLNFAMKCHGSEAFFSEKILICSLDNLDKYETFFIKLYNSHKEDGYNIMSGGYSGSKYDNETRRERIGKTVINNWENNPEYIKKTTEGNLKSLKKRSETGEMRTKHKDLPHNIYFRKRWLRH